jgi:ABC-2 type transport system ATP-binding protein
MGSMFGLIRCSNTLNWLIPIVSWLLLRVDLCLYDSYRGEFMVRFNNINKTYRVAKRRAGLGNALKALFSREYELVRALKDVSFTIQDGEMVGYIGPNGAGKSTTIKIMCGVLTPDSGECIINGRTPWKERVPHVREIGVVFGQRSQLWWDVPVIDSFELVRDMYKVNEKRYKNNLDELSQLLDLGELLKTPARSLSLGQRMRCEIAASLLHNPKTLFLDEPTIGLDVVSKIAVRQFIKKLNAERGTTVILTTHDMQDIEALTERILLIGKGKILLDGNLDELKKHVSERKTLVIKYCGKAPEICEGMILTEAKEGHLIIALDPSVLQVSDTIAYLATQTELLDVSVSGITTEEMVAMLYKEYRI